MKSFTTPILLVVLLGACGKQPADYLEQGKRRLANGMYAEAEIDFRKVLQEQPNSPEAEFGLGEALMKLRQETEAVDHWRKAVQANPSQPEYKAKLADFLLAAYISLESKPANLIAEAERLIRDLAALQPEARDTWRLKGALAAAAGKWGDAQAAFRQTMALSPAGEPEPRLGLAKALFQDGKQEEARQTIDEQLARDPKWAAGYDLLYAFARMENNPPAALLQLEAKQRGTGNAMTAVEIARHHFEQGQAAEAAKALAGLPAAAPVPVLVAAGDLLLARGNWPEARKRYEQAVSKGGKEGRGAERRILDALIARGEAAEALVYCDRLLDANPKDRGLRLARAALVSQDADPNKRKEALAEFGALDREASGDAPTLYNYGVALRHNGDRKEAAAKLREAANRDRGYIAPRLLLGEMALEEANASDALRLGDEALRIDGNHLGAKILRLKSLAALGRVEEARRGTNELVTAYPQLYEARVLQGMVALAERKSADALKYFRALYQPGMRDPRPLTGLAGALIDGQQAPEALLLVGEEVKKNPNSSDLRFLQARVALAAGQPSFSAEILKSLRAKDPKNARLLMQLSDSLEAAGDLPGAVAAQAEVQAMVPKNVALLLRLASLESQARMTKEAEAHYRSALEIDPNSFPALNNLASLLAEENRSLDEAERLARRALQAGNNAPEAQDTLAWVRWKKDRSPESKAVLEGLVRKYPQNPYYRAHLAELTKNK